MHVQIIDGNSLAIYIEPPELESDCFSCGDEFLARIARDEFLRIGAGEDVGEMSLVAYSSGGGLLVFAERSGVRLDRAAVCYPSFETAAAAAESAAEMQPRWDSLTFCEGRWYLVLHDSRERLDILLPILCEFGERTYTGDAWLTEHGERICASGALELLRSLT